MNTNITTSEKQLLLMLLQREEKNLHAEINHAATSKLKQMSKERLQMVTTIMSKLKLPEHNFVF